MTDTVTVQLRFGVDTPLGLYQDTLSFTEEEWAKRDQKAIDARKQALADAWVAFRGPQIAEEEKLATDQGKRDRISEIVTTIDGLSAAKAQLEAELG